MYWTSFICHRNDTTTPTTNVEDQVEPDEDGDQFYECSSNISSLISNFKCNSLYSCHSSNSCSCLFDEIYCQEFINNSLTTEDILAQQTTVWTNLGSSE